MRLWKSEAIESFDFEAFNIGDYFGAVNEKIASEAISKILYPDDEPYIGKHLRLAQQYFFVSCALQDMIRLHLLRWKNIHNFSDSFAVQLNDTHPAIAVAELMRLLVDEHLVSWDKAWYITQNTFSYTNHAILPEALQKWPLPLFAGILPRHLEIIYEINRRFLDEIWLKYPDNNDKLTRLTLIDESDQKYVRMAHLASLGSHVINGVSEIHSELLKKTILPDLYEIYPERFYNVTNGVTPRHWIVLSNPGLAELITNTIGDRWISQLEEIKQLESFANDPNLIKKWQRVKIDLISSGFFSQRDVTLFKPLIDSLLCRDEHMILADYQSYIDCQDRVSIAFKNQKKWTKMSILTVARMGKFSSDRSIREYNEKIWHAAPLKIDLENT